MAGTADRVLRRFFSRHDSVGVILPSGWYGRPHDSYFAVTSWSVTPGTFRLVLEGNREVSAENVVATARTRRGDHQLTLSFPAGFRWDPDDGVSSATDFAPGAELTLQAWE